MFKYIYKNNKNRIFMMNRFIGGQNIQNAVKYMTYFPQFLPIFDYAKEGSNNAKSYHQQFIQDLNHIQKPAALAIKASSFAYHYGYMSHAIANGLIKTDTILLDAEDDESFKKENIIYSRLLEKYNKNDVYVYKTYQMYRKHSIREIILDLNRYENIGIKLVRGAYYEKDKSKNILFNLKKQTDENFDTAIAYLSIKMLDRNIKLMIATHNQSSVELAMKLHIDPNKLCFAQLLGMNDKLSYSIVEKGYKCYKYVPYGHFFETYPYLLRRLYENYGILKFI